MIASTALRALVATGISIGVATGAGVEAQDGQTSPLIRESLTGHDSFQFYCSSCHGATGKGDGPLAAALKIAPTDLTSLARLNDGTFPRNRVLAIITGAVRPIPAHGSGDMPVWGVIFRALDGSPVRVRVRIENLVGYVESLQTPSSGSGDAGARLFRTHCASCHGSTAHGDGPIADQLRQAPRDLTRFALRNGGVFPSERVYRIIDGRDVRAHGDREMPVWGDVFRSAPERLTDDAVKARIDAIVGFLRAIQQRDAD